ncbi:hypothetical protein BH23ACT12_BH23ACT12_09460 [soil metagenome]
MFKASIALVLIAFAALAYGWVANNDAMLYGSIGASILAGLLLLRATLADRKAGYPETSKPARPERPARAPRERKPSKRAEADYPPASSRSRRGGSLLDADEMTRELDTSAGTDDFLDAGAEPAAPFRPQSRRRERLPAVPQGAAWAGAEDEDEFDDTDFDEEDPGAVPPNDYDERAAPAEEGAAAADDFRSRLAAVLGSAGEEAPPVPPAQRVRRAAPKPVPLEDEEDDEAPAAAAQRRRRPAPRPVPAEEPPPVAPKRRGRKRASESVVPAEPQTQESDSTEEPEWVPIDDVPRISRVTQPGGGFARPDVSEEITHYRPRRPAVAATPSEPGTEEPAKTAAPRRRRQPATGSESKIRSVGSKPASSQTSGLTRVSPAEKTRAKAAKEREPDAPPPRRGRPPKSKP